MQHQAEPLKHVADAIVIPTGAVTAALNIIGVVNGLLTMVVLILTAVWTVYRIRDMHRRQSDE